MRGLIKKTVTTAATIKSRWDFTLPIQKSMESTCTGTGSRSTLFIYHKSEPIFAYPEQINAYPDIVPHPLLSKFTEQTIKGNGKSLIKYQLGSPTGHKIIFLENHEEIESNKNIYASISLKNIDVNIIYSKHGNAMSNLMNGSDREAIYHTMTDNSIVCASQKYEDISLNGIKGLILVNPMGSIAMYKKVPMLLMFSYPMSERIRESLFPLDGDTTVALFEGVRLSPLHLNSGFAHASSELIASWSNEHFDK